VNETVTKAFSDGAVILTTSTGALTVILDWAGSNAAGIGAISTLFFGFVYVIFQWLAYKKLTLADKNERDVKLLKDKMDIMLGILERPNSQNNDKDKG